MERGAARGYGVVGPRGRFQLRRVLLLQVAVAGLGVLAQQVLDYIAKVAAVEQQGLVQAGEHRLEQC